MKLTTFVRVALVLSSSLGCRICSAFVVHGRISIAAKQMKTGWKHDPANGLMGSVRDKLGCSKWVTSIEPHGCCCSNLLTIIRMRQFRNRIAPDLYACKRDFEVNNLSGKLTNILFQGYVP